MGRETGGTRENLQANDNTTTFPTCENLSDPAWIRTRLAFVGASNFLFLLEAGGGGGRDAHLRVSAAAEGYTCSSAAFSQTSEQCRRKRAPLRSSLFSSRRHCDVIGSRWRCAWQAPTSRPPNSLSSALEPPCRPLPVAIKTRPQAIDRLRIPLAGERTTGIANLLSTVLWAVHGKLRTPHHFVHAPPAQLEEEHCTLARAGDEHLYAKTRLWKVETAGIAERRMEGARVWDAEVVASSNHQTALGRANSVKPASVGVPNSLIGFARLWVEAFSPTACCGISCMGALPGGDEVVDRWLANSVPVSRWPLILCIILSCADAGRSRSGCFISATERKPRRCTECRPLEKYRRANGRNPVLGECHRMCSISRALTSAVVKSFRKTSIVQSEDKSAKLSVREDAPGIVSLKPGECESRRKKMRVAHRRLAAELGVVHALSFRSPGGHIDHHPEQQMCNAGLRHTSRFLCPQEKLLIPWPLPRQSASSLGLPAVVMPLQPSPFPNPNRSLPPYPLRSDSAGELPWKISFQTRASGADFLWRSRLVRHRSRAREALGSNPRNGMGVQRVSTIVAVEGGNLGRLESRRESSEEDMGQCRNARAGETGDPRCASPDATRPQRLAFGPGIFRVRWRQRGGWQYAHTGRSPRCLDARDTSVRGERCRRGKKDLVAVGYESDLPPLPSTNPGSCCRRKRTRGEMSCSSTGEGKGAKNANSNNHLRCRAQIRSPGTSNPENKMIKWGDTVWHCSSESILHIQNSITPLDCQRIKEYVTLSEDWVARRVKGTVVEGRYFEFISPRLITSALPPPYLKQTTSAARDVTTLRLAGSGSDARCPWHRAPTKPYYTGIHKPFKEHVGGSHQRMEIFLRFLRDPAFQRGIVEDCGVHYSTVCKTVHSVADCIVEKAQRWETYFRKVWKIREKMKTRTFAKKASGNVQRRGEGDGAGCVRICCEALNINHRPAADRGSQYAAIVRQLPHKNLVPRTADTNLTKCCTGIIPATRVLGTWASEAPRCRSLRQHARIADIVKAQSVLTSRTIHLRIVSSAFDSFSAALQHVEEHIIEDGWHVLDGFECCTKPGFKFFSSLMYAEKKRKLSERERRSYRSEDVQLVLRLKYRGIGLRGRPPGFHYDTRAKNFARSLTKEWDGPDVSIEMVQQSSRGALFWCYNLSRGLKQEAPAARASRGHTHSASEAPSDVNADKRRHTANAWRRGQVSSGTIHTVAAHLRTCDQNLPAFLEDVPLDRSRDMQFQHDGCPAHLALVARQALIERTRNQWLERSGVLRSPDRSPELTPLESSLFYGDIPCTASFLAASLQLVKNKKGEGTGPDNISTHKPAACITWL
ncbi:hypothetical protein PR048_015483 [Dryococelus australis]|uniref:Uncharacterized protein n=1 Tax=Dryococelus australis TaxID=614101 RepID=A0ABQ9HHC5_9NEOP|nr:hypothetical protein PR048_015483 [Dryococelus australis]